MKKSKRPQWLKQKKAARRERRVEAAKVSEVLGLDRHKVMEMMDVRGVSSQPHDPDTGGKGPSLPGSDGGGSPG